MTPWKSGALAGALIVAAAGLVWTSVLHGETGAPQERDREPFVRAMEVFGRGTQIGVTVRDVEDDDAKQAKAGVIVEEVAGGSAAEKAGIKNGDAIVEFDGERVRSVRQLTRLIQETPTGRKVPAVVMRGGQRVSVTVVPERRSGLRFGDFSIDRFDDRDMPFSFQMPEPPVPPAAPAPPRAARPPLPGFGLSYRSGNGRLGITVEDLSEGLSDYFGVKKGALVRSVRDGSPAAKAGVKAGDVITSVNGTEVDEPSDITRAIDRIDDNADFTIEIVRDKKPQTLKGKLESRERARTRTRTIV